MLIYVRDGRRFNSSILVGFSGCFRLINKNCVIWTLVGDFGLWTILDPLLCDHSELVKSVCNLHWL